MKTKRILSKFGIIFLVALALYIPSLYALEFVSSLYSDEIQGVIDIETILSEEKLRLDGCDDIVINVVLIGPDETPYALKITDCKYEIGLHEKSNRSTIKHELYHIADKHTDCTQAENWKETVRNELAYIFSYEPKAVAYGAFGIKL